MRRASSALVMVAVLALAGAGCVVPPPVNRSAGPWPGAQCESLDSWLAGRPSGLGGELTASGQYVFQPFITEVNGGSVPSATRHDLNTGVTCELPGLGSYAGASRNGRYVLRYESSTCGDDCEQFHWTLFDLTTGLAVDSDIAFSQPVNVSNDGRIITFLNYASVPQIANLDRQTGVESYELLTGFEVGTLADKGRYLWTPEMFEPEPAWVDSVRDASGTPVWESAERVGSLTLAPSGDFALDTHFAATPEFHVVELSTGDEVQLVPSGAADRALLPVGVSDDGSRVAFLEFAINPVDQTCGSDLQLVSRDVTTGATVASVVLADDFASDCSGLGTWGSASQYSFSADLSRTTHFHCDVAGTCTGDWFELLPI